MDLLKTMLERSSVRNYTKEHIKEEDLNKILQAGLLSCSGRNFKPWEFIVVKDRETLDKLSTSREHGSAMLQGADACIVVIGHEEISDTWIEDCSICMANMHLMASSLHLGSCWIQVRNRYKDTNIKTTDYIKELLDIPSHLKIEAMLSLGCIEEMPKAKDIDALPQEKVHYEKY